MVILNQAALAVTVKDKAQLVELLCDARAEIEAYDQTLAAVREALARFQSEDVAVMARRAAAEIERLEVNQVRAGVPCWCPFCQEPHSVCYIPPKQLKTTGGVGHGG